MAVNDLIVVNTTDTQVIVNTTQETLNIESPVTTNIIEVMTGERGPTGPINTLTIGSVTAGTAAASITGTAPNQVLNLVLQAGPPNTLAIGTVTQGTAAATITGTSPNQTLNLTLPPGPANSLAIGTVTTVAVGGSATASITGTAPSQTLNIGIPTGATGATGPAPNLSIGTVTTGVAGSSAAVSVTGTNPNYIINFTIPTGSTVQWYGGTSPPPTGTGVVNDWYVVNTGGTGLGDVYKKTAVSTWTLQGNIRGAAGSGTMSGPGSSVIGNIPVWANTTGTVVSDSGFNTDSFVKSITTTGTGVTLDKRFHDVLDVAVSGTAITPTLIIRTNITYLATMARLKIVGWNYKPSDSGPVDLDIFLYAYRNAGVSSVPSHGWTSNGSVPVTSVTAYEDASNKLVLVITFGVASVDYPHIKVKDLQLGFTGAADSMATGWTGSFSTDLTGLTAISSPAGGVLTKREHTHSADSITSGVLAIARGGTGSTTKNFVDLTTAQTIAGVKTFAASTAGTPWAMNISGGAGSDGVAVRLGTSSSYPNYIGSLFGTATYGGLGMVMTDNGLQLTNIGGEFRVQTSGAGTVKNVAYTSKTDGTKQFNFASDTDMNSVPPGSTFTVNAVTYKVRSAWATGIRVVEDISAAPATGTLTGVLYAPTRMTISNVGATTFTGAVTATSFTGVGTGLSALNASLLGSGTVPDARLPLRLYTNAAPISAADFNTILTNGWWTTYGVQTNGPAALGNNSQAVFVEAQSPTYMTQTAFGISTIGQSDTITYRRHMINNVWGSWYKLSLSQTEQDNRYVMLTGTQTIAGAKTFSDFARFNGSIGINQGASSAYVLGLTSAYPATTVNGSNSYTTQNINAYGVPISAGVTESGYRIALAVHGFLNGAEFAGTLTDQRGVWARVGANSTAPTGTITNSYGVFIENLDAANVTVTNKYGLYQSSTSAKNYFGGNVGIGTAGPTEKLHVSGNAIITGTIIAYGTVTAGGTPGVLNGQQVGIQYAPTATTGTYGAQVSQMVATPAASSTATYYGSAVQTGTSSGNVNNFTNSLGLIGVSSSIIHRGSGAVTGAANFYSGDGINTGGGTITNFHGLYISTLTAGINNYSIVTGTSPSIFAGNVRIGGSAAPTVALDVTGAITATGIATFNGGGINLANGTSNVIALSSVGLGGPSFTTRSIGTKFVLYGGLSGSSAEYALGIEASTLWNSVPTTANQFKWYGGTTLAATLSGLGGLTLVGAASATGYTATTGNITMGSSGTPTTGGFAIFSDNTNSSIQLINPATAAANVGSRISFQGTATQYNQGVMSSGWTGAATTDAYLAFTIRTGNALTEIMRLQGTTVTVTGAVTASGVITGSSFSGSGASLTSLNGTNISTGTVAVARLGSGSPGSTNFLRGDGAWTVPTPTMVGLANVANEAQMTRVSGGKEAVAVASGTSGTVTLDASAASIYTLSPTAAVTTLTISNVPATGNGCTITLFVTQGATPYAIATPSGGVFYGAASPTQVANKRCAFTYITTDGGTTWHCSAAVQV